MIAQQSVCVCRLCNKYFQDKQETKEKASQREILI